MAKAQFECIILAGVNGAGKSTLFHQYIQNEPFEFVNADEIAKSLGFPKGDTIASITAGRIALRRLDNFIKKKIPFIFETTLTSHQSLNLMNRARANGFLVNLEYVALDNVMLSKFRVAHRVKLGGHDIPQETLERRYSKSFNNLPLAMKIANNITIYDNSQNTLKLLYAELQGEQKYLTPNPPRWLENALDLYHKN